MGPVITINCATLVNKGLEVIEAHELFDIAYDQIDVVVHPQSTVHSMVEFCDGSTLVQASPPDMRLPIALALGWPDRIPDAAPSCDWSRPTAWHFEPLDDEAFPAVQLARDAGRRGGVAPAIYNAANEECVAAFVDRRLPFLGIVDTIAQVLGEYAQQPTPDPSGSLTLADVVEAETWARTRARQIIEADVAVTDGEGRS
jgi:1-deoxy-D-xylulose-5-phosphate reductoisomerase